MRTLRRRLNLLALLVLSSHLGALAPASVLCCRAVPVESREADDCCPAGSHSGAMCPLHARKAAAGRDAPDSPITNCRLVCANNNDGAALLGVGGLLPRAAWVSAPLAALSFDIPSTDRVLGIRIAPPSPPPRG